MNTTTTTTTITAYLRNLRTDREIRLNLPIDPDELDRIYDDISEGGSQDVIIADAWSECAAKLHIDELDSITEINELAAALSELDEYGQQALGLWCEECNDAAAAISHAVDGDYVVYTDCRSMADVAEQSADETGLLDELPQWAQNYIDYNAMGRDMEINGTYRYVGEGVYIQLTV